MRNLFLSHNRLRIFAMWYSKVAIAGWIPICVNAVTLAYSMRNLLYTKLKRKELDLLFLAIYKYCSKLCRGLKVKPV